MYTRNYIKVYSIDKNVNLNPKQNTSYGYDTGSLLGYIEIEKWAAFPIMYIFMMLSKNI